MEPTAPGAAPAAEGLNAIAVARLDEARRNELPPLGAQAGYECGGCAFSSAFDGGNLGAVRLAGARSFALWTSPDCVGTEFETKNRSWWYFSVQRLEAGAPYTFEVQNLNVQGKLFSHGHRPVWRCLPMRPEWEPVPAPPVCRRGTEEVKGFRVAWSMALPRECAGGSAEFALAEPWTLAQDEARLAKLDEALGFDPARPAELNRHGRVYYHRGLLTRSLEGRPVQLITISDRGQIAEGRERLADYAGGEQARAFAPSKRVVYISARVHPAETPASFVFGGVLEFLTREDDGRAAALLANFVFKLVPVINPDGVFRGHQRTDTRGENLNRHYIEPDPARSPAVAAIKSAVEEWASEKRLFFYLDLHAHANTRGAFLYANLAAGLREQLPSVLYTKLAEVNSAHFDFGRCTFSDDDAKARDAQAKAAAGGAAAAPAAGKENLEQGQEQEPARPKPADSKAGSGRWGIYCATQLPLCFTLECHYTTGRKTNPIARASGDHKGRASPSRRGGPVAPRYTAAAYEEVARGVLSALLDLEGLNPWSRLPNTRYGNMAALQNWCLSFASALPHLKDRKGVGDEAAALRLPVGRSAPVRQRPARPRPSGGASGQPAFELAQ